MNLVFSSRRTTGEFSRHEDTSRKKNTGCLIALRPACVLRNTFPVFLSTFNSAAFCFFDEYLRAVLWGSPTSSRGAYYVQWNSIYPERDPCTVAVISDSLLNCYYLKRRYLYPIAVYLRLSSDYWRKCAKSVPPSQETLIKRARVARENVPVAFPIPSGILKSFLDTLHCENNGANSSKSLSRPATSCNFLISRVRAEIKDVKCHFY